MSTYLTEEERKICRMLNVDEEDYLKTKDEGSAAISAKNQASGSVMSMTDQARRICSQMGVSEDEYMKELRRGWFAGG